MNTGETPRGKPDPISFEGISACFGAFVLSQSASYESSSHDERKAAIRERMLLWPDISEEEHVMTAAIGASEMKRWNACMKSTVMRSFRTGEDEPLGHPDNPADLQARADIRKKSREASKEIFKPVASYAADWNLDEMADLQARMEAHADILEQILEEAKEVFKPVASYAADLMISRWCGRVETIEYRPPAAKRRFIDLALVMPPSMDDLLHRADDTAQWSCSPNTERAYNSALREFAKFAAAQGLPAFPADPRVIAAFLQHRIELGLSPQSLNATLAALKHAHSEANQPDPTAAPKIRAITRGHRRRLAAQGKRSKQTRGLSESNLAAIVAVARANSGGDIMTLRDIAIISLLREGLLRCGECAALRVRDFSRKEDGSGRLFISRSKTDQEGQGETLFLGEQAAAAAADWLAAAPADGGAPLFRWIRRGEHVQSRGLTNKSINLIIKSRGEAAGIFGLSGHSGRVGMAQDLVAHGASIAEVALAGRWKTPGMVLHYASRQEAGRGAVAKYRQNRG